MENYDIVFVGGGIVGVSTAWHLKKLYRDAKLLLIEKELSLAKHQTGHNSGVIHAGVYYTPGSLKANLCKRGAAQTIAFCQEHKLPYRQCGKLLVATDILEYQHMEGLEERCYQNGIENQRLSENELKKMEPSITGLGAIYVPSTGITDYKKITAKMAELFVTIGGEIKTGSEVQALREKSDGVQIQLESGTICAKYVVVCGGLQADRLSQMMGLELDFQIIPFRGEYYQLPQKHNRIVSHLIYPIPDPNLPFLGVHLTKMIDGSVTVGPNAVLGWKREGYNRLNLNLKDSFEMLKFPGFWRVVWKNLKSGLGEAKDSFYKPGYLSRVQKYCPSITVADLHPYPTGIRAQAVDEDGNLIHDFLFAESSRSLHVCNAPSPAATSAIPIGEYISKKVQDKFSL
ncbi:MAG: L-2-hydroxyglutarate oxidase [Desulfobacterales bacterium]